MSVIWVTRPWPHHQHLIDHFCQQGHDAFHFPCIHIKPIEPKPKLPCSDWLVISSQHTPHQCKEYLLQHSGKVYVVGPKTQQSLRSMGVQSIAPSSPNVQSLFNEYLIHSKGKGLVLDGVPRVSWLTSRLMSAGKVFDVFSTYQRESLNWGPEHQRCLLKGLPDIAIITSQQVLQSYVSLMRHANLPYQKVKTLVISEAIKNFAETKGINDVLCIASLDQIMTLEF